MSDIDAPNTSADPERFDAPHAAEEVVDTSPTNVVDTASSSVNDLLRDIGAACGAPAATDAAAQNPKSNDWFARAVDQLAAGAVPELSPPSPDPGVVDETAAEVASVLPGASIPAVPIPDATDPHPAEVADEKSEATPAPTPLPDLLSEPEDDPFSGATFAEASLAETESAAATETLSSANDAAFETAPEVSPATMSDRPDSAPAEVEEATSFGRDDLRELDDALAGDVEELLQGNFDTVSAVLDDAPDELPYMDAPADVAFESAPLPARDTADPEHVPQTVSELLDPAASEALPERPVPQREPEPESRTEPEPVPTPMPPEPTAAVIEAPAIEPAPIVEVCPPEKPAGLLAILVEVLAIIGVPLRYVPTPLRPVVDWVALSLVFWVPIVWVIAIFMVGQQ